MKHIILCEGKHDVHLVSSFFEERGGSFELKTVLGEEIQSSMRGEESRQISNFRERRNPYHVLVKSDNGKQELEKVFSVVVNQLLRIDPEITVLVDLDGGTLETFVDGLDERIRTRHDRLELDAPEVAERNHDMVAGVCEVLTTNGKKKGEFQIVAFEQTLERVADVSRDDETDEWKAGIEDFLGEADHIYDFLHSVLPDKEN
ncbi:hypothetical protein [Halorussus amylolyticus]|uniref:hypothetical protein n=1 Tax=Halorussus amylolyticus TaxID=1126242 RepID=UPI001047CBC5|nr:hypothetical protein [Halorussus amylolyticus]